MAPAPEAEPVPLALVEEARARRRTEKPDMPGGFWDRVAEFWTEEVSRRIRFL